MKKGIAIVIAVLTIAAGTGAFVYIQFFTETLIYFEPTDFMICDIQGSQKHVQMSPVLVIRERGHDKYLEENSAKICDIILFVVRSMDEEQLRAKDINETLSWKIRAKLSLELDIDFVDEIIFPSFLIA